MGFGVLASAIVTFRLPAFAFGRLSSASVPLRPSVATALAPVPASVTDVSGLAAYVRSWPLKHYAIAGASSAALAAVTLRSVQYKGGA